MESRFALLRHESRFLQNRGRILERFTDDVRQFSFVRQNLRGERKKKNHNVGDEKSADRSNQIWERTPRKRAPVHLAYPAQSRGECAIGTMTLGKHAQPSRIQKIRRDGAFRRRLQDPVQILGEE